MIILFMIIIFKYLSISKYLKTKKLLNLSFDAAVEAGTVLVGRR